MTFWSFEDVRQSLHTALSHKAFSCVSQLTKCRTRVPRCNRISDVELLEMFGDTLNDVGNERRSGATVERAWKEGENMFTGFRLGTVIK